MTGDGWQTPGGRPGGPGAVPPSAPVSWTVGQGAQQQGTQQQRGPQQPPRAPQRPVIPLRPLGLGDVLGGAFTVFRRNAKVLLLWSVLLSGVLGLVSSLASTFGQRSLQSRVLQAGSGLTSDSGAVIAGSVTLWIVLSVLVPFLAYIGRGFLVAPVAVDTGQRVLGRRGTFRGLWALLAGRRLPVLWWVLLQLGAGLVAGIVFVVSVFGAIGALGASSSGIGVVLLVAFLLVMGFGVVVVWLGVRLALTVPTIVLEGRGVFGSVAQSWRLTRGAFWRTFGILALVQVMFGFAASIAAAPLSIAVVFLSGVFDPLGQTGSTSATPSVGAVIAIVVGSLLTVAVQCVTDVLSASVTTFLTIDRRIRTEALDQRIASHLETGQPSDPFAPAPPVPRQPWPQQGPWQQGPWHQGPWQQPGPQQWQHPAPQWGPPPHQPGPQQPPTPQWGRPGPQQGPPR